MLVQLLEMPRRKYAQRQENVLVMRAVPLLIALRAPVKPLGPVLLAVVAREGRVRLSLVA